MMTKLVFFDNSHSPLSDYVVVLIFLLVCQTQHICSYFPLEDYSRK